MSCAAKHVLKNISAAPCHEGFLRGKLDRHIHYHGSGARRASSRAWGQQNRVTNGFLMLTLDQNSITEHRILGDHFAAKISNFLVYPRAGGPGRFAMCGVPPASAC
jgi:hypothetical protein